MATISINDKDLESVRRLITESGQKYIEHAKDDPDLAIARKMVRKINQALKKRSGHDCMGQYFMNKLKAQ